MNKKAFSFVEILVAISILAILAIVATTANNNIKNNSYNTKVISDLNTIETALISYTDNDNSLPLPDGNNNNFSSSGTYIHDFENSFGTYGKFTQDSLAKMYLDSTPLDPRTNQYYSYGITKDSNQFEIAGVIYDKDSDSYNAKVNGNYTGEEGIYNLIKEYNGNSFVSDKSSSLPYNPYERILVATDTFGNTYLEGDTIENSSSDSMEIFFSDGSVSVLDANSTLVLTEMEFPSDSNLTSNIKLFLQAGAIWTKATKLDEDSTFDVITVDATASVRGTIFAISYENNETTVTLEEGELEIIINGSGSYFLNITSELEEYVYENSYGTITFKKVESDGETKSIIINGNSIFSSTENIELTESNFSIPDIIYINPIETSVENKYLDEIIEEDENKVCYIGGEIINNGNKINAYKESYVPYGESCTTPTERECIDGILEGDKDYKYLGPCIVKDLNQCFPYDDDNYLGGTVKNQNENDEVSRIDDIYYYGIDVGDLKYKRIVKCNENGRNYSIESEEIEYFNCNETLIKDEINNTCICGEGKIFSTTSGKCEEPILYSGEGCNSCPNGYIKTDEKRYGHEYRKCIDIYNYGELQVCAKREGFLKNLNDKSWSGYLE